MYINPYFTDEETEAERYLTQITVGICAEGVLICAEIKTTGSYSPRQKKASLFIYVYTYIYKSLCLCVCTG